MIAWVLACERIRQACFMVICLVILLSGCNEATVLTGTNLGQQPAPDFMLTDMRGQHIQLSELRGKAVALAFIYTQCPDICPVTAEHLRLAYEQLPPEKQRQIALVAVTVDPQRDDPAALQAFSRQHGLADNPDWFALTGTPAELEPVWRAYGIDPGVMRSRMAVMGTATPMSVTPAQDLTATLTHTDAIYLIDPQGRERVLVHSDLDPTVLARNLSELTT